MKPTIQYKHLPTPFKHKEEYVDSINGWNSYETWKAHLFLSSHPEIREEELKWISSYARKNKAQLLAMRLNQRLNQKLTESINIDWLQIAKWCLKLKK